MGRPPCPMPYVRDRTPFDVYGAEAVVDDEVQAVHHSRCPICEGVVLDVRRMADHVLGCSGLPPTATRAEVLARPVSPRRSRGL